MDKRYQEIMDQIEVTDEMRSRVLSHIAAEVYRKGKKKHLCYGWMKLTATAACILLIVMSGIVLYKHYERKEPEEYVAGPIQNSVVCESLKELSKEAAFSVETIETIPFEVKTITYQWCFDEYAEVQYEGKQNILTYRKTAGKKDISGDYNEYLQKKHITVNGVDYTISGNDDLYYLATAQEDDYSYSIDVTQGISYTDMRDLIKSMH